jgi:UDPglucose--hexose-1-phosphate uridylyltransferase
VEGDPGRPCPFCPGHEDDFPPALETYARDGEWLVRVAPNKYPAFQGVEPLELAVLGPVFTQAPASGIHEVLVLSPDHQRAWADLDDRQVALVMAAVRDRVEEHGRHAVVRHSLVIVNHGREAGASLEHPHGQLLGTPFVARVVDDEVSAFAAHADGDRDRCLLCTTVEVERAEGHRVVDDAGSTLVLSPYWAGSPYELLVLPTTHRAQVTASDPPDVVAVGRAVRDGLRRLRALLGDVAYNLVLHTAPRGHDGPYHWHVHVLPRVTSVAGFEQGTGALINIVAPEMAARQLTRQAPDRG